MAAVVVPVLIYRRQSPKRRLDYSFEVTPLMSSEVGLDVSYRGVTLANPHIVQVTVRSASRGDIPSSDFDASRKVEFRLRPRQVAILKMSGSMTMTLLDDGFALPPQLIRPKSFIVCQFLCDGPLDHVDTVNSLINVGLVNVEAKGRQPRRKMSDGVWMALVLGGSYTLAIALLIVLFLFR